MPVHGVGGRLEVGEQRDGAFEGGELASGDGREARVVEGRGECVAAETRGEGLGLEGADAAAQALVVACECVPGYEEGMLLVLFFFFFVVIFVIVVVCLSLGCFGASGEFGEQAITAAAPCGCAALAGGGTGVRC